MYTVRVQGSGNQWVDVKATQLHELFPTATLTIQEEVFSKLKELTEKSPPPSAACDSILLGFFNPASQK